MADRLQVSTDWLSWCAARLIEVENQLRTSADMLSQVDTDEDSGGTLAISVSVNGVNGSMSASSVADAVSGLQRASGGVMNGTTRLIGAVRQSIQAFDDAENRVTNSIDIGYAEDDPSGEGGFASTFWSFIDWLFKRKKDTPQNPEPQPSEPQPVDPYPNRSRHPFDPRGLYGGNQSSIASDYANHERYRQIIERNTGHTFTDGELSTYFDRMKNEGCGYIALCNAIFAHYANDPEGFRRAFGFDMYAGDDYNYNELFVDLYSTWDNRSTSGAFNATNDYDPNKDAPSNYSYWTDPTGSGTEIGWRGEIAEKYLSDHGISATSNVHSGEVLTADMYNNMVSRGEVTQGSLHIRMSGKPAYLYDANGQVVASYSGGHAMTVTGTTGSGENAMLIVSSWGRTYYVKPGDFCATGSDGRPTGSMGYMNLDIRG